jgi:hypothetical protein
MNENQYKIVKMIMNQMIFKSGGENGVFNRHGDDNTTNPLQHVGAAPPAPCQYAFLEEITILEKACLGANFSAATGR